MNYESPAAFRMALEARLASRAREARVDLNRLRRGVVFERLLARLERADPGRWVLKGGMALEVRWRYRARSTRDLDLALRAELFGGSEVRLALAGPLATDSDGDWFHFAVGEAQLLSPLEAGRAGWRFSVEAALAGRTFAEVNVDVVVRGQEIAPTDRLRLPGTLAFAGIDAAEVDVIDRRQHFAEKLHALTRSYADHPSSRVKDLADLVLLVDDGLEPSRELLGVVHRLFTVRASHEVPRELPDPARDWTNRYRELAAELDISARTIGRSDARAARLLGASPFARGVTLQKRTRPSVSTSPQAKLSSVIKGARDTMRKDAGLNGDLDRIPQLAWLLFLRAFDGLEQRREVTERRFRPAIEVPYRWRDWAADPVNGPTGDALVQFVNGELLPYLRQLRGTGQDDPRDVLAAVFKETFNRMLSGYLLRDVVNKVNEVDFASSDDIHTMAHLYESMLREMRDAAGDAGEFYTPRPVIRFMVQQIDPKLGEIVLDPACGTGGFLVETLEHLRPKVRSVEELRALDRDLRGIEKKPLPYLLGMMNLLLHEVQQPHIVRDNALARPLTEIRNADRVDIVLTNPPFGGEEEKALQSNFPEATRTAETVWLFLQLVQRILRPGGRCAIVVPNTVLFADGVGARIKERLLAECDVHTIVRLPPGVFAPYTSIPTNVVFFEKTGRTKEVWFYELPPPEDRKGYAKTRPLRFEELGECQRWWGGARRLGRKETERAWRVPFAKLEASTFNMDLKNPSGPDVLAHRGADEILHDLLAAENEILGLLLEVERELAVD